MNDRQEIGISELAQMLGITPEAVRKYEAKGIVQVKRDKCSKYRKYTAWEIMAMLHARRFGQMGFTLNQVMDLLATQDGQDYIESIEALQMKLAREVARKRKLIMMLDRRKKDRCSIEYQEGRIQIERMDETLYFDIMQDDKLSSQIDTKAREEWIDALPFTSEYLIFSRDDHYSCRAGFAIRKSDAAMYGLEGLMATHIISESLCATCILEGDYDELITERKISEAVAQVEEKGYQIMGDIVAEIYDMAKIDGKYTVLHKCYFPIEI